MERYVFSYRLFPNDNNKFILTEKISIIQAYLNYIVSNFITINIRWGRDLLKISRLLFSVRLFSKAKRIRVLLNVELSLRWDQITRFPHESRITLKSFDNAIWMFLQLLFNLSPEGGFANGKNSCTNNVAFSLVQLFFVLC